MNKVMATKSKAAKAAVKKLPKEVSVEAAAEAKLLAENGHHAQGGFSTNVVADDASGGGNGGVSPVVILGGLVAAGGIAAAAAGGGGEKVIVQPVPTPVPAPTPAPVPAPVYTVTAAATSVDEGSTIRFTISGTNAAGKVVSYQLTGSAATAADTSTPLTGTVTLDSNGKAYVDVVVSADKLTEGAEKLNLVLSGGEKVAADVTVNDTSLTPPPAAQTFTLTTGVDTSGELKGSLDTTSTAGNDIFVATASTLTSGDRLDGGAGNDKLQITSAGDINLGKDVVASNIEEVTVDAKGTTMLTMTNFTGVTSITSVGSTATAEFDKVQSIPVVNLNATSSNMWVNMAPGTVVGLADEVTVNLNTVATSASNDVRINGVEKFNVALTGVVGGTSPNGTTFRTTLSSTELESVTVTGSASAKLTATFTGASLGTEVGVFNASAATGSIDAIVAAGASGLLSVTGGSGNDVITVGTITKDMTLAGGNGVDTLIGSTAAYSSTAAVQPGVNVTGFEVIGANGGTIDQRQFANNTFVGAYGAGTYDKMAATFASLTTEATSVVAITRGTASTTDSLAVNLNGLANDTLTLTANDEETLTFNSAGAVPGVTHTVGLTSESVTKIVATGANALNLGTIGATSVALATVDASAHTGSTFTVNAGSSTANMTVTGSAGIATTAAATVNTITTGSGNDKITGGAYADVLTGGAGNDSVDGGAGNDTISGGLGADSLVGGAGDDSIDGGLGNDFIDGGDGNDTMIAGGGVDTLSGGAGNDRISVATLVEGMSVDGGAGTDRLANTVGSTVALDTATNYTLVQDSLKPTITGVESAYLRVAGTAATELDMTNVSGMSSLFLRSQNAVAFSLKDYAGGAMTLTTLDGGTAFGAMTLDGTGQSLSTTLYGYNSAATTTVTGVAGLTIAAQSQYTATVGSVVTNLTNGLTGAITASNASSLTVSTSGSTVGLQNTGALTLGATAVINASALSFTAGNYDTLKSGAVTAANGQVDTISLTSGTGSKLNLDGDINVAATSTVRTMTISVGEGGQLFNDAGGVANVYDAGEIATITAGTITSLSATLGATSTAALNLAAGITSGTISIGAGAVLDSTAMGAAGVASSVTLTGNGNLINTGLVLTGSTFTLNASGLNDANGIKVAATSVTTSASLTGTSFADTLTGGAGNDTISGGTGDDAITGAGGADNLTGGLGADTFVLGTRADTKGASFAAADATNANIDKITDFVGNGAAAGDVIQLSAAANVYGTALDFDTTLSSNTTATVTAVTVATAADFTSLAAAIQAASAGVASTNAVAQIYDVTVSAGALAGRYMVINDDTAAIAATDTFVALTGITGALHASDFTFG